MTIEQLKENTYFSDIIIQMIINVHLNQTFKLHIEETYPFLAEKINRVYLNPNEPTTQEIKLFVEDNKSSVLECVASFSKKTKNNTERLLDIFYETEIIRYNLKGKILKTTTQKWPRFVYEIRNAIFDKFSVIKQNEDVYVFFV